jgi:hypothetical protein
MKSYLRVKVQPRSAKPGVEKTGEGEYKVHVSAAPDKGRANTEVIKLLAGYFDIPRSCVKITRGETSRQKLILIEKLR